jgi:DNA-binding Lrp family transcriptional regulator
MQEAGKMKEKELLILSSLRRNARETLTEMSHHTRVPISTIFDKLRQFDNDIIRKHTTLLDFAKLGFSTRANLSIKVDKNERDNLRDFLEKHQNINSVYKINNGFDFLIECIFRNIRELEEFIETLETKYKIKGTQVYYIIEEIKREEFMADPNLLGIITA